MAQFDINQYKDWKINPEYASSNTDDNKSLMNGDERVIIKTLDNEIDVDWFNINYTICYHYTYDKGTKTLIREGRSFYNINFGIWEYYDKLGRLTKKEDRNKNYGVAKKDYTFSLKDLIEKIKKEYNVNLEDKKAGASVDLNEDNSSGQIFYEVTLPSKGNPGKRDYVLVNGANGKVVYESHYYPVTDNGGKKQFQEYLDSLKYKKDSPEQIKIPPEQKKDSPAQLKVPTEQRKDYSSEQLKVSTEQEKNPPAQVKLPVEQKEDSTEQLKKELSNLVIWPPDEKEKTPDVKKKEKNWYDNIFSYLIIVALLIVAGVIYYLTK